MALKSVDKARKVLTKRAQVAGLQESIKKTRQKLAAAKAELVEIRRQK
jgi:hypothetical protein